MQGNLIRVYASTPDRRRVLFLYRFNSRLKVEPLALTGFCVYNPLTNEFQNYVFSDTYQVDVRRELSSFVSHVSSYEKFSLLARLSREAFYSLLQTINMKDFNTELVDKLF